MFQKNAQAFVLSQAPTHHSFTEAKLKKLKHKVHLTKTVFGIFLFYDSIVFIKVYIFIQQKLWTF